MSVSHLSHAAPKHPVHHLQQTPPKQTNELTESAATKAKEAAAPTQNSAPSTSPSTSKIDVKA